MKVIDYKIDRILQNIRFTWSSGKKKLPTDWREAYVTTARDSTLGTPLLYMATSLFFLSVAYQQVVHLKHLSPSQMENQVPTWGSGVLVVR